MPLDSSDSSVSPVSALLAGLFHNSVEHEHDAHLTIQPDHVHWFESLPSSNRWLSDRIRQQPALPPSLCVARLQTAGVGRRGRQWHSPSDSITFSISYPFTVPPLRLAGLSLVAGLCVVELLASLCPGDYRLKWPNDILLDKRKLAGILVEIPHTATDGTGCQSVTGIGINVSGGDALGAVDQPYALLSSIGELPDLRFLTGRLAGALVESYALFERRGWPVFRERWQQFDVLAGEQVEIIAGEHRTRGLAVGVADDGGLRVRVDQRDKVVYAGEVSVRARAEDI